MTPVWIWSEWDYRSIWGMANQLCALKTLWERQCSGSHKTTLMNEWMNEWLGDGGSTKLFPICSWRKRKVTLWGGRGVAVLLRGMGGECELAAVSNPQCLTAARPIVARAKPESFPTVGSGQRLYCDGKIGQPGWGVKWEGSEQSVRGVKINGEYEYINRMERRDTQVPPKMEKYNIENKTENGKGGMLEIWWGKKGKFKRGNPNTTRSVRYGHSHVTDRLPGLQRHFAFFELPPPRFSFLLVLNPNPAKQTRYSIWSFSLPLKSIIPLWAFVFTSPRLLPFLSSTILVIHLSLFPPF